MKYIRIIMAFLCFIIPFKAESVENLTRFTDDTFHYSVCVPREWGKSFKDIGYRHILTASRKNGAEITVSVSKFDDDEKNKWDTWKEWYQRGAGSGMIAIIESKEFTAGKDAKARILLFEYSARGRRMLQRTMLLRYGTCILIVECKAPINLFGKYTEIYDAVMSSIDCSGSLQGEKIEFLKGQDGVAVKKEKKQSGHGNLGEQKHETTPIEEINKDQKRYEEPDRNKQAPLDEETKKVIEQEMKKIEELEKKGIIEKID